MYDDKVTVVIPTSPIPSHPSTDMIAEVLKAIRAYFPTAKIIICADGVRGQVEHRRSDYNQYIQALANRLTTMEFGNTMMPIFTEPTQQAEMLRRVMGMIETPLILFVEHDAILRDKPPIEWGPIISLLLTGQISMVRFYHWDRIWHEHEHLMREHFTHEGVEFVKTIQFSGWPNIAATGYYEYILNKYFIPGDRKMIETVMYGPVCNEPWEDHKIVIYYPEQANTFNHLNGRVGENGVKDPGEW